MYPCAFTYQIQKDSLSQMPILPYIELEENKVHIQLYFQKSGNLTGLFSVGLTALRFNLHENFIQDPKIFSDMYENISFSCDLAMTPYTDNIFIADFYLSMENIKKYFLTFEASQDDIFLSSDSVFVKEYIHSNMFIYYIRIEDIISSFEEKQSNIDQSYNKNNILNYFSKRTFLKRRGHDIE